MPQAHQKQVMRRAWKPLQAADQAAREAVWSSCNTGRQLYKPVCCQIRVCRALPFPERLLLRERLCRIRHTEDRDVAIPLRCSQEPQSADRRTSDTSANHHCLSSLGVMANFSRNGRKYPTRDQQTILPGHMISRGREISLQMPEQDVQLP